MKKQGSKHPSTIQTVFLSGVVILFFFQLLTEFVEGIYLYGLLGTDIPPEIGLVAIFFVPLLLLLKRGNLSDGQIKFLISLGLAARTVEIMLPTRGRLIFSGLGLVAFLLAFPAILALPRTKEKQAGFSRWFGLGFISAILVHMLFRALNSGSDLSGYGMFRLISIGLAIASLVLLWKMQTFEAAINTKEAKPQAFSVLVYILGIFGVLSTIYFAIAAPNVVARWAGVSPIAVFAITLVSWGLAGWWWLSSRETSRSILLVTGLVFVLSMGMAILPFQVQFPTTADGGYPLLAPGVASIQVIPLYAMLVLSPVLFFLLMHYLDRTLAKQPGLRLLGGSFGLGGTFLLLMIFAHVFTTVYDYIPVVGPFFRNKYWLVYLVAGFAAVLPILLKEDREISLDSVSRQITQTWLGGVTGLLAIMLAGMSLLSAAPSLVTEPVDTLRVFTYNIQQGNDDTGERNFDGQIALVKSTSPDIVGLQESDTARIAGGNADVVAYFADRLDMHAYYGPPPITGTFGIALLSKYPIQNPQTYYLYSEGEQVAVIRAEIEVSGTRYTVFVTHLGNGGPIIQMRQMLTLMHGQKNVIAMGDFNYRPYEEQYAITTAEFNDAYSHSLNSFAPTTWGEGQPFEIGERIDHVFVSPEIPVRYVEYFTQPESDHPGLLVELGVGN